MKNMACVFAPSLDQGSHKTCTYASWCSSCIKLLRLSLPIPSFTQPAVKLGQHVAMLDHLVPAEYVQTMRKHMLNRCPISSWEEVAGIVREDLGAPPEKLFASFSPAPLASASLAQVHEATGFDGRRLAVKVGWCSSDRVWSARTPGVGGIRRHAR